MIDTIKQLVTQYKRKLICSSEGIRLRTFSKTQMGKVVVCKSENMW